MNNFYQISDETKGKIINLIDSNNISIVDGGILAEFEEKSASLFGQSYGVATCNGTSAIHLAYFAIGIEKNDEVLMPTYGFHAMASPLLQLGGIPVYCDIDKETLTIDVNDMKKRLTPKTKAIMVFQPWGNVANISEIVSFAKKNNLLLLSDSSHAPNVKWKNKSLGEYFDIICASFGKGKLISGGELGVFTTNNKEFRDRALLYSHTNRVPKAYLTDKYKEISNIVGIKYRPHPFAITLALDQMNTFNERNNILLENISKLISIISEIKGLSFQNKYNQASRNYWKIILVGNTEVIQKLRELAIRHNLKIESNHYKSLLHEDSIFTKYYKISQTNFPVAETLKDKIIQIDSMQLFDNELLDRYAELFSELKGDLND